VREVGRGGGAEGGGKGGGKILRRRKGLKNP